jgi:hypothetical protein
MNRFRAVSLVVCGVLVIGLASAALGMKEPPRPYEPPDYAVGRLPVSGPFVLLQQGDTTWIQVHTDTTNCPGDFLGGHGGEATGGPDGSETWCFEDAEWPEDFDPTNNGENVTASDSCGTNAPWDVSCFTTVDVRSLPSQTGINFWHLDSHRTNADASRPGPAYTGNVALWCGSDSLWIDGNPVECGIWSPGKYPGHGNQWNCTVQLELSGYTGAGPCTLAFDPRYDTECKYDYFYVDYYDGTAWQLLATFNGASNTSITECGTPADGSPDYYGFGDVGQPNSCSWVTRTVSGQPAFFWEFAAGQVDDPPKFRWRFTSDGAWSDADGRGDTDGACFIDNVTFQGSGATFVEDFEHNSYATLTANGWTFPDPDGVAQCWHLVHDVDPPFEGNEPGEVQSTCTLDSSLAWRGRPDQGYASGTSWRNKWFYRLRSPEVPIPAGIEGTGCVVQYDQYICALDYTDDYTDTKVRFYDVAYDKWCPWTNIDGFITYGGCTFWNFDDEEDVTQFYENGTTQSKVQFAWDLLDVCTDTDFCLGKHKGTEHIVDNVSIGFFDGSATIFSARYVDLFQDSFHESICTYNSLFDPYDVDTLNFYNVRGGTPPEMQFDNQLYVEITDKDDLVSVELFGSIDGGSTWKSKAMTKEKDAYETNPDAGGTYYANFCPSDFAGGSGVTAEGFWEKGIELWYYVKAEDGLGNIEYWPGDADPGDPDHTGTREDYAPSFVMSILPIYPDDFTGTRILLVDGYPRWNIDYTECMAGDENTVTRLVELYEKTLSDAGYCFDVYNVSGGGSSVHIHPLQYTDYDCVFWFTGPYFSNYLVDEQAQLALRAYLAGGGKVVFCGDQLAYCMHPDGANEDELGGEFLAGILGTTYQEEMEAPFDKPYVYLEAAPSVDVFGTPTPVNLDSILVYRSCPTLRDMSYIVTNSSPPSGYTAQPLLYMQNPIGTADPADGAIYVEYQETGQLVYVNYDLSGFATHRRTECDGTGNASVDFDPYVPGAYFGRVDLVEVILNDLFGLVPPFPGGGGGTADVPTKSEFKWALNQNYPNPAKAGTDIRFEIARSSNVSIKVYNAMGQLVRTLENKRLEPGKYSTHWDGTNQSGQRVSSGVYFYKMEAGQFGATKKMLVVK